jgi:hypothetical protein
MAFGFGKSHPLQATQRMGHPDVCWGEGWATRPAREASLRLKGSPLCHLSLVRGKVAATMRAFLVALVLLASIVMIALRLLRGRIPAESAGPTGKAEAAFRSRKISDIGGLSITLDVNEKPSLFILLTADGTINRMGSGTGGDAGGELFIGRTSAGIFEAVRSQLTEATMQRLGQGYEHPNPHGIVASSRSHFNSETGLRMASAFSTVRNRKACPRTSRHL